jgi:hypothetical protein
MDPFVSAGIIDAPPRIPRVFRVGRDPQIGEAVVGPNAIDVIDMPNRPLACDVEPSQAMPHVKTTVDSDMPIPARLLTASNITGRGVPRIDAPKERSGVRFISKQATDF